MVHDCDPGIDDAFALATIAGMAPEELTAVVAVAGNVGADLAWKNAASIVRLLGLSVPVGHGASTGLAGPFPAGAPHVHGLDGLGGVGGRLPEVEDGGIIGIDLLFGDVLATGALTDVALALRNGNPVDRVIWMGGSVEVGGNITPAAEFNAWCDPEAADEVLRSGVPVLMIPLDVTTQVELRQDDVNRLESAGEGARLWADAGRSLMRVNQAGECAFLHDPVAAVAAVRPDLLEWRQYSVRCETRTHANRGQTVVDRGSRQAGPVAVAVAVDAKAVRDLVIDSVISATGTN